MYDAIGRDRGTNTAAAAGNNERVSRARYCRTHHMRTTLSTIIVRYANRPGIFGVIIIIRREGNNNKKKKCCKKKKCKRTLSDAAAAAALAAI